MTNRVLVLGATGFIGQRVVAQLAQSGAANVVAASRHPMTFSNRLAVESLALDATDAAAMDRALAGITGVVNCIAGTADTIVGSAKALFAAAARAKLPPRIVHFSSLAAYGSITGEVDETVPPRGDLGEYSAAKLATEQLAASCPSVVILRPGIVYGPGSSWWSDRIARLLCAGRLGDLGAAGNGLCNLVFVDDVAAAALLSLCTPNIEGRTFNLGCSPVPTWNEYFTRYARALTALPVRRISTRRLAVERNGMAPLLQLIELAVRVGRLRHVHTPPPIRPWLLELCNHRISMIVRQAEGTLGVRWTNLDEGLETTAAWFRAGGRT
jgi:nucleoside-diphosphate-sugar epimerase